MSTVICPSCSTNIKVFGSDTEKLVKDINIEILESFPLNESTAEACDKGTPIVLDKNAVEFTLYKNVAHRIVDFLKDKTP